MPTMSSFGTMPPALERRIAESTPGAILQPQPPPCEKLVRRTGAAPGTAQAVVESAVMRFDRWRGSIVSAAGRPCRHEVGQQCPHRAALGRGPKQRLANGTLRSEVRRE